MKKKIKNKVLVIHGPNLHLLGTREPTVYGNYTLKEINATLKEKAAQYGITIDIMQSNSESDIVDRITKGAHDILIINPAAYTHTSVAIRDAILAIGKPVIEVHLSNIYTREDFRKKSLVSDVAVGVITGFGATSYLLALDAAVSILSKPLSQA
ncbi:MAG: type II 3-dehydroquinate dehydratase [Candidatus Omnitrophota bacterium]